MRVIAVAVMLMMGAMPVGAQQPDLGLPIGCTLGDGCFIQQFPDLAEGTSVADPWCGGATYDGHDGTDFRILSMADVAAGTPVLAAADGVVLNFRDGEADRLVVSEADREAVSERECGNGVRIDHGEGWETLYCHMREGSVTVQSGQSVKRGDQIGMVGASGLAQFPHVHLSVRHNGEVIDPFTGRGIPSGCGMTPGTGGEESLWDIALIPRMRGWEGEILDIGFAGAPVDYDSLVVEGAPAGPTASSEAFVGWVWAANLRQGDALTVRVETADGTEVAENTMVMDRNKAAYSAFAGKRGAPAPGTYRVIAVVVRDGVPALTAEDEIDIP